MSYRNWSPLACVIASLIAVARPAHAVVDCAELGVSAPWNGATDLPTNTLVWCTPQAAGDSSRVQLTDARGVPVSGTQTQITASEYELLVFRPEAELAPNAQYRFRCSGAADDPSPLALSSFTTGAGPRHVVPALPDTASSTSVTADVEGLGPDYEVTIMSASPAGTILVLDLDGTAALDASQPSGSITESAYTPYLQTTVIGIGRGPCTRTWPEAGPGASTLVRVGAFDVTGAFSGWTESTRVTIPDDTQSSGCQFGASAGSWKSAGLLAALACMLARRERRRTLTRARAPSAPRAGSRTRR